MDTLVLDNSPLSHFARANELEALGLLVEDFCCITTTAVRHELEIGAEHDPRLGASLKLPWIETVSLDDLDALYVFAEYMDRLGNRRRNAGEASVLAWAEVHGAQAYVDDQVACDLGRQRGVRVHRTLALIVDAYEQGRLTEARCQPLVNALVEQDARFPQVACGDIFAWARHEGLLA